MPDGRIKILDLNWSPIKKISFIASYTDEQGAPTTNQINDPVVVTPNVSVFDFTTGQPGGTGTG